MKKYINNKGISLALVVGLLSVIMIASAFCSNLVIRSLHSAHKIESADRAYFAAEAGIEDALYELSPHFAGYETPSRGTAEVRDTDFIGGSGASRWENNWEIKNLMTEEDDFTGNLKSRDKLTVNLFKDISGNADLDEGAINAGADSIVAIDVSSSFSVFFKIPYDRVTAYSSGFDSGLTINNDMDDALNEDGPEDEAVCTGSPENSKDGDCDGKEDEDNEEDPVIYWKILDSEGRMIVPKEGCMSDGIGSEICEKDFAMNSGYLSVIFGDRTGVDQNGTDVIVSNFISSGYDGRVANAKVQAEFLIVAPLTQSYNDAGLKEIGIPHIVYEVTTPFSLMLPMPFFTVKSDGWFNDFKQSITTYITPQAIAPLFDFTIIQQQ